MTSPNLEKRYETRLKELVGIPSVSSTSKALDMGNVAIVDCLANWFSDLGFNIEVHQVEEGKQNLIATLGEGSGGLLLGGHTDTVPYVEENWQQDPFQLTNRDHRFYGLGATDMKGFFPVVLAAIEGLDLNDPKQPLTVLATADEESSMSGARALVRDKKLDASCAIIGEPTGMKPIRMHKGIAMEIIRIKGSSGHSSNPDLGNSALEAMNEVMSELLTFRSELQEKFVNTNFEIEVPTLNLGCIHGGDNPNRICGHCELEFDLRPLPGMSIQQLQTDIYERVRPIAQRRNISIQVEGIFPPVEAFEEPQSSPFIQKIETLTGEVSGSVAFATEAPFLQQLGTQTVIMGPGSIDQAHQPNEYIEQDQIKPAIQTMEKVITDICL